MTAKLPENSSRVKQTDNKPPSIHPCPNTVWVNTFTQQPIKSPGISVPAQFTGYFHRLISPDVLPNLALSLSGFCTLLAVWRQTILMNRQFIASNRPKLVVRELQMLPPNENPNVVIRYIVSNSGTTIAEIVESVIEVKRVDSGSVGPLRDAQGSNTIKDDLKRPNDLAYPMPSLTIEPGSYVQYTHTSNITHPPDPNQPRNGVLVHSAPGIRNNIVFFRGRIVYIDGNKTRRQMAFCRRYSYDNDTFIPVPDYEYED